MVFDMHKYIYSESVLNALDKTEILKKNPFGQNKRELQLISFTLNLRFLYELLIFLYISVLLPDLWFSSCNEKF